MNVAELGDRARLNALFTQRFEDFEVGDRFRTQGRTLTETDVVQFAHITGDNLPVHTDRHWAERQGMYGQRTANGLLIVSYTVGLLPLDPDNVVALRRIRDVVFKRPAFLGDTIHGEGRIERLVPLGEFGAITTVLRTFNQHGELIVRGTFEMLWTRGSGDAAG